MKLTPINKNIFRGSLANPIHSIEVGELLITAPNKFHSSPFPLSRQLTSLTAFLRTFNLSAALIREIEGQCHLIILRLKLIKHRNTTTVVAPTQQTNIAKMTCIVHILNDRVSLKEHHTRTRSWRATKTNSQLHSSM